MIALGWRLGTPWPAGTTPPAPRRTEVRSAHGSSKEVPGTAAAARTLHRRGRRWMRASRRHASRGRGEGRSVITRARQLHQGQAAAEHRPAWRRGGRPRPKTRWAWPGRHPRWQITRAPMQQVTGRNDRSTSTGAGPRRGRPGRPRPGRNGAGAAGAGGRRPFAGRPGVLTFRVTTRLRLRPSCAAAGHQLRPPGGHAHRATWQATTALPDYSWPPHPEQLAAIHLRQTRSAPGAVDVARVASVHRRPPGSAATQVRGISSSTACLGTSPSGFSPAWGAQGHRLRAITGVWPSSFRTLKWWPWHRGCTAGTIRLMAVLRRQSRCAAVFPTGIPSGSGGHTGVPKARTRAPA